MSWLRKPEEPITEEDMEFPLTPLVVVELDAMVLGAIGGIMARHRQGEATGIMVDGIRPPDPQEPLVITQEEPMVAVTQAWEVVPDAPPQIKEILRPSPDLGASGVAAAVVVAQPVGAVPVVLPLVYLEAQAHPAGAVDHPQAVLPLAGEGPSVEADPLEAAAQLGAAVQEESDNSKKPQTNH